MKKHIVSAICAAFACMALLSTTVVAQQKTVKACEDEWKANKEANQAKKITEKAYVEQCRADSAAKPAAATPAAAPAKPAAVEMKPTAEEKKSAATPAAPKPAWNKTVKACEDEWKADKAANQAKKITQKAYVEKCRGESATAAPATAPTPAAPAATAAPAKPAAPAAAPAKEAAAPPVGKPAGEKQYALESQAKASCPSATVVWANLDSKIYHFVGHSDYGRTKRGAYMCEKDADAQGMRAAKNEKHP
jgi:hypothetical protein